MLVFYKVTADFDKKLKISDEHVDINWFSYEEATKIAAPNCHIAIQKAFA